jgi:hypothetical protein
MPLGSGPSVSDLRDWLRMGLTNRTFLGYFEIRVCRATANSGMFQDKSWITSKPL